MFVVGGSYKGFYINQLTKIRKIDLLVFNQDIFYEFDYDKEKFGRGVVSSELVGLNAKLKCPIIINGVLNKDGVKKKCFIICMHGKVSVIDYNKDVYLYLKGKLVLIGSKRYVNSRSFATISMLDYTQNYQGIVKSDIKNYFLCYKKGVIYIQNGKIYRKFRKYCYFALKFNK